MNTKERLEVMKQVNAANEQHVADWKNKQQITGVFINVEERFAAKRSIEKTLDSYYELLGCDSIDITEITIDGKCFDVICDDEALLKSEAIVSAVSVYGDPMMCGNLFVVKFDGVDDVTDLTDDEAEFVLQRIVKLPRLDSEKPGIVLSKCNY